MIETPSQSFLDPPSCPRTTVAQLQRLYQDLRQKSTAATLRSRRAAIEAEMAALESRMSALRKEDMDIVKALAGVVYPVLSLPNEITSEIFTQYVDKDLMVNRRYGKHYSPLCLASVCSLWRALALSHCSLWTHLGWRRDEPFHLTDLLRIWLPRAGGLPLHLNISLPKSSTQAANVLRTLGQYSAQWQSLEIGSQGPIFFPNDIRGPFPYLTKFHLKAFTTSDGWTTLPLLSNAPFLREVHLELINPRKWQSSIPGSQLTKLELTHFDIESSLGMLAHTPNLENLDFTCDMRNSGPDPAPSPPLNLMHLRTIRLCAEHGPELLNYLVLPALDFIDVGFTDESTDEIEGMVARSGCTPRRFEFYMYEPGFERIYRCMAIMPTLRRLQMPEYFPQWYPAAHNSCNSTLPCGSHHFSPNTLFISQARSGLSSPTRTH